MAWTVSACKHWLTFIVVLSMLAHIDGTVCHPCFFLPGGNSLMIHHKANSVAAASRLAKPGPREKWDQV